jgi:hypothetical protein
MSQLLSSMPVSWFPSLTGSIHATCAIRTALPQILCAQVYIHFSKLENSTLWLLVLSNIIAAAVVNNSNNNNDDDDDNNNNNNNNNKPMTTNVSVTKT